MSVMEAVIGSLREGMVGAVSGGVSGATMIIPVMPFESIMTFQAAGDLPGKPSMMDVAKELFKCAMLIDRRLECSPSPGSRRACTRARVASEPLLITHFTGTTGAAGSSGSSRVLAWCG
jgi:hypothetical protein